MVSGKKSSCVVARSLQTRSVYRALLLVASIAACDRNDDDCKRSVNHLFDITTMSPPGVKDSEPSADEQRVIDLVKTGALATCRKEGLDPAARDCILATKSLEDLEKLGACPGIVAHHPSWVIAGPPPKP
jgi:hypothetical protein